MTQAEFDAYLGDIRAYVAAQLAELERVDWSTLTPRESADLARLRDGFVDLQASLTGEAIAAELEATGHAGRDLTPAEVRGLAGDTLAVPPDRTRYCASG